MKKNKTIAIIIGLIVILIAFLGNIVNLAINIQWFKEVGYLSVYFTKLTCYFKANGSSIYNKLYCNMDIL